MTKRPRKGEEPSAPITKQARNEEISLCYGLTDFLLGDFMLDERNGLIQAKLNSMAAVLFGLTCKTA